MGLIASMLATKQPSSVTVTSPSTHVHMVEIKSISKLREKYCSDDRRCHCSPTFTVDGLDWKILFRLDGDGDLAVYVKLATEGAVAWARVKIGLVDWTTGRADTFFPGEGDDEYDPVLFDAGSDGCSTSGTRKLASWEQQLRGSRYLRHDCLQIQCVICVCHSQLAFLDMPVPRFTPRHVEVTGELGSHEGADVLIHVGDDANAEPISAHSSMLEAYAPRFLKKHNLGRRRRPKTAAAAMRVNVDDMPRQAMEALLRFVYTDTLPVVDGLSADGYRDMFWYLLFAADRYGMRRLSAICTRLLCNCIDVESAAASLEIAHRRGFQQIKDECLDVASDPDIYGLVQQSKGYAKLMYSEALSLSLVRELWEMYYLRERKKN